MAGPAASILIPQLLADTHHDMIDACIDMVGGYNQAIPQSLDAFWVQDTRPIGGNYHTSSPREARPFAIEPALLDLEPDQLAAVAEAFEYTPRSELVIVAFCNQLEDHQVLGELSLFLAEKAGGVVSFGGALHPSLALENNIDADDWAQMEPQFLGMVAGMPGRILSVPYKVHDGRNWVCHVVDSAFLRAWLRHPKFRMIK